MTGSDVDPAIASAQVITTYPIGRESTVGPSTGSGTGGDGERCDAALNRRRLLAAAHELVAETGVEAVTMDAVAARAGVGKGTLFRRFGSRAGLMHALLDQSEVDLQHKFLFGAPPLGPGADPITRLIAFGDARLDLVEVEGDVLRAAESIGDARFAAPARGVHVLHMVTLLRAARVDGDPELLAHSLLASLEASLVLHQIRALGISPTRIRRNWARLVRQVCATAER